MLTYTQSQGNQNAIAIYYSYRHGIVRCPVHSIQFNSIPSRLVQNSQMSGTVGIKNLNESPQGTAYIWKYHFQHYLFIGVILCSILCDKMGNSHVCWFTIHINSQIIFEHWKIMYNLLQWRCIGFSSENEISVLIFCSERKMYKANRCRPLTSQIKHFT